MKKHYLYLVTALTLAGCTNDDYVGSETPQLTGDGSIAFNMSTPNATRGELDGKTAAEKLGNKFIVWGEKNEVDASTSSYEATDPTTVFKNYVVEYKENTTNTTNSNTKDWEYVGVNHSNYDAYVISTIGNSKAQTIKYWDMNATDYTFTAVSALETDIQSGYVKITKITKSNSTTASVYDKGYTIELTKDAKTGDIYFSDRVNIAKSNGTTTSNEQGKYGGHVKFTFRKFETKIRFGFYETVPGYKVQVKNVTYNSTTSTSNFGVDGSFYALPTDDGTIKYNVTYEDGQNGTTQNRVTVKADASVSARTSMTFGTNIFGNDTYLNTTSSNPTYDKNETDTYTAILPNTQNATDMSFKISYTLVSEDTGEKIEITDKEVVVPSEYCQWKPNFAYTYLFKISDQSADLYPITFDACVVEDETGKQETITEVGGDTKNTSITTFAYDDTNKKIIESDKDEYEAGSTIYATVMEGSTDITLTKDTNVKLYTVTTTDADKYPVTEKSVAKALDTSTYPVTTGVTANIVASESTSGFATVVSKVPAEDGTTHSISALKWTDDNTTTNGTYYYAIQYKNTDSKYVYKVVKVVKQ